MKVVFASDHAGFELKEKLKVHVAELGFEVEDKGAHEYRETDDYPDFVGAAARAVAADPENTRAIVLGGSGQGEAMVANRVPGVRAAVYYGGAQEIIPLSRQHNDANVLSLGARFLTEEEAKETVKIWLNTGFSEDERHVRRIGKIDHGE
jgi:ribose 5-phosphate isomerase B